jgi:tRNA guanosine-2'-O-methyltransferase
MLWERTCGIFFLPATNLLRTEVYGLTARFFDSYFELDDDTGLPMLDLRLKDQFWQLIQAGLKSKDSTARKYGVYIFKRVIDLTTKITTPNNIEWTHFFKWEDDKSQAYQNLYEDFFLLYDIMHENVLHLVDPILPRFELLLFSSDPAIDPSWWTLLLYRGFQNEAMSVRKRILEYVFGFETKQSLLAVARQYDFLFGVFFAAIDTTSLYTVSTLGAMVSPTGEMLRGFIRKLIEAVEDTDEKVIVVFYVYNENSSNPF